MIGAALADIRRRPPIATALRWPRLLLALGLAAGLAACAEPTPAPMMATPVPVQAVPLLPPPVARAEQPTFVQEGLASWYGKGRSRHATASGEKMDRQALTAAHPVLPFGTVARVTNLRNGQTVKVKINDRGPHGRAGRIVDLSAQAARELDMTQEGLAEVTVQVFASDQPRQQTAAGN